MNCRSSKALIWGYNHCHSIQTPWTNHIVLFHLQGHHQISRRRKSFIIAKKQSLTSPLGQAKSTNSLVWTVSISEIYPTFPLLTWNRTSIILFPYFLYQHLCDNHWSKLSSDPVQDLGQISLLSLCSRVRDISLWKSCFTINIDWAPYSGKVIISHKLPFWLPNNTYWYS